MKQLIENLLGLVPSIFWCKGIPKNKFKNTVFIWRDVDKVGTSAMVEMNKPTVIKRLKEEGIKYYPAPTLAEIIQDIKEHESVEFKPDCILEHHKEGTTRHHYPARTFEAITTWFIIHNRKN